MKEKVIFILFLLMVSANAATSLIVQANKISSLRDPFGETILLDKNSTNKLVKNIYRGTDKRSIYIYNLKYRDTASVIKILKEINSQLVISGEPESKQLIIKAVPSEYNLLATKIKQLDLPLDQILIEVKVLEINHNNLEKLGIVWEFNQNGLTLTERRRTEEFIQGINLLLGNGSARIMANPRVTTILGKEALIHIGDQVPYTVPVETSGGKTTWQVNYISAGINLRIIPQKAEPGYIGLILNPEVASIKQWKTTPGGEFPIVSSRKVETYLRLKDNESFILGGLLNEEEMENINKIPILGDIPFLNIFFTNRSVEKVRSDVVFLVTARKI